jgi:hypothetical protein
VSEVGIWLRRSDRPSTFYRIPRVSLILSGESVQKVKERLKECETAAFCFELLQSWFDYLPPQRSSIQLSAIDQSSSA